jgi:hypothetical protein
MSWHDKLAMKNTKCRVKLANTITGNTIHIELNDQETYTILLLLLHYSAVVKNLEMNRRKAKDH